MPAGAENDAPVERRGWCLFERALSSLTKDSACCLALSQLPPEGERAYGCWASLIKPLRASRAAPLSPDAFERMLTEGVAREQASPGSGVRFTNGSAAASSI